jgi:hypothetical protein
MYHAWLPFNFNFSSSGYLRSEALRMSNLECSGGLQR